MVQFSRRTLKRIKARRLRVTVVVPCDRRAAQGRDLQADAPEAAEAALAAPELEPDLGGALVVRGAPAVGEPLDEEQPPAAAVLARSPGGRRVEARPCVAHLGPDGGPPDEHTEQNVVPSSRGGRCWSRARSQRGEASPMSGGSISARRRARGRQAVAAASMLAPSWRVRESPLPVWAPNTLHHERPRNVSKRVIAPGMGGTETDVTSPVGSSSGSDCLPLLYPVSTGSQHLKPRTRRPPSQSRARSATRRTSTAMSSRGWPPWDGAPRPPRRRRSRRRPSPAHVATRARRPSSERSVDRGPRSRRPCRGRARRRVEVQRAVLEARVGHDAQQRAGPPTGSTLPSARSSSGSGWPPLAKPTRAPPSRGLEVGVGDRAEAAVGALAQQRLVQTCRTRLGSRSCMAAARSV